MALFLLVLAIIFQSWTLAVLAFFWWILFDGGSSSTD